MRSGIQRRAAEDDVVPAVAEDVADRERRAAPVQAHGEQAAGRSRRRPPRASCSARPVGLAHLRELRAAAGGASGGQRRSAREGSVTV